VNPAAPDRLPPRALIHRLTSVVERLDWTALYPLPQPVEVELGSGDGSFLARCAQLHPERNFLGVERLLGRLRKLERKGQRAGLQNLRGLSLEASYFVEYLLRPESVQAFHVYFPDPWPKRKHRSRRLVNERFPELARRALAPGGAVYLRTDNADYFRQMQEVFSAHPGFELVETPPELSAVLTDFERDFHAKGIQTLRLAYRRKAERALASA
jgi:tRNA (guanine-N7-)-methyltransferase